MAKDSLPLEYHLEIYEGSFLNDPVAFFRSDKPFMAFAVGGLIDPGMWAERLADAEAGEWYSIEEIVHRVWQIDNSHIGHQVGLRIVPVRPGS